MTTNTDPAPALGADTVNEAKPTTTSAADLALAPVKPWDLPELPETDVASSLETADSQIQGLSDMLSGLKKTNESWMKGQISGDVSDQIRINSAESAMASGIGATSPAARALQAKDFGLTSMDIQQKGMAFQQETAKLQDSLARISEARYQFRETLGEERRKSLEQSRQFGASLEQDALRTQLQQRELLLRQDMFNKEQNLKLVGLVSDLVSNQAQHLLSAASGDIDSSNINTAYKTMMNNINNILQRSNQ